MKSKEYKSSLYPLFFGSERRIIQCMSFDENKECSAKHAYGQDLYSLYRSPKEANFWRNFQRPMMGRSASSSGSQSAFLRDPSSYAVETVIGSFCTSRLNSCEKRGIR